MILDIACIIFEAICLPFFQLMLPLRDILEQLCLLLDEAEFCLKGHVFSLHDLCADLVLGDLSPRVDRRQITCALVLRQRPLGRLFVRGLVMQGYLSMGLFFTGGFCFDNSRQFRGLGKNLGQNALAEFFVPLAALQ